MGKLYFLGTCLLTWPVGALLNKRAIRAWILASAIIGFWGEATWCFMGPAGQHKFVTYVYGGMFASWAPPMPDPAIRSAYMRRDSLGEFGVLCAILLTLASMGASVPLLHACYTEIRDT